MIFDIYTVTGQKGKFNLKKRATFPIEQSGDFSINLKWISFCIVWRFAESKVSNCVIFKERHV